MILFFLPIYLIEGLVTFLSPDELRNITLNYITPIFTKVEHLQNYGKLIFAKVENCEVRGEFSKDNVVVTFTSDIGECNLYTIASSVEAHNRGAYLAITSDDYGDDKDNTDWENNIYMNYFSGDYIYGSYTDLPLNIFCLILFEAELLLKSYKDQSPIWIKYSYKEISRTHWAIIEYGPIQTILLTRCFSMNF